MGKKQAKQLLSSICILLFLFILLHSNPDLFQKTYIKGNSQNIHNPSSSWEFTTGLQINEMATTNFTYSGNWNWAVTQPWCSGEGVPWNPYVISNLSISGLSSGRALAIVNSRNISFVITNVNITDVTGQFTYGIYFLNSTKGEITYNRIMDCGNGIMLDQCEDMFIGNNFINNTDYESIEIKSNCDNISVFENIIAFCGTTGVYVNSFCTDIHIYENNITECYTAIEFLGIVTNSSIYDNSINYEVYLDQRLIGIHVGMSCSLINISRNKIYNTLQLGIWIENSVNCTIEKNNIFDSEEGMLLYYSQDIVIVENFVNNTQHDGIGIQYRCRDVEVLKNILFYCFDYGIYVYDQNYEINVSNNEVKECHTCIFFEKDNKEGIIHNNSINFEAISNRRTLGIYVKDNCTIIDIVENQIFNTPNTGIYLFDVKNCSIIGNSAENVYDNLHNIAVITHISLVFSPNCTVINNTLKQYGFDFYGTKEELESLSVSQDNLIDSKPLIFHVNEHNLRITDSSNVGQLIFAYCNNTEVSGLNITSGTSGIYFLNSNHMKIHNNSISNCEKGVYLEASSVPTTYNCSIFNNRFENCYEGVNFYYVTSSNIENNAFRLVTRGIRTMNSHTIKIENNDIREDCPEFSGNGIHCYNTDNITIRYNHCSKFINGMYLSGLTSATINANEVTENSIGIYFYGSSYNHVYNNTILNNYIRGVNCLFSMDNYIHTNVISNSSTGIYLWESDFNSIFFNYILNNSQYGIEISDASCENNTLYCNIFETNTDHALDNGNYTNWDNGEYGNYWDGFDGNDLNGDGIFETPYLVSPNGTDRFPLARVDLDNDDDGLPMLWEIEYGLNNTVDDSNVDSDSDNLNNLEEYENGTNPNNGDTDGDGYTDGEEVEEGTDPLNPSENPSNIEPSPPPIPEIFTKWWFYAIIGVIAIAATGAIIITRRKNLSVKTSRKRNTEPQL